MSGQKKKNQATTAKAPKTDAKYADAIGWESSRLSLAEKSEARAWLTAKILGATNIALVAAIVIMMPLKETLPYVIEVDKSTGMSTILSVANAEEIPVSEIMDKYWLSEYVQAREAYDYRTLENDYIKTRELSMPNVFEPYSRQFGTDKNSMEQTIGDTKRILVELLSVVPNGNGIATVRFRKKLVDTQTGQPEGADVWTARIGYEYVPTFKVEEAKRLINPFGFKVTTYRVDQELSVFMNQTNEITTRLPNALAYRVRVRPEGSLPRIKLLSSRATADCVVPMRAATSACVSPADARAAMILSSSASSALASSHSLRKFGSDKDLLNISRHVFVAFMMRTSYVLNRTSGYSKKAIILVVLMALFACKSALALDTPTVSKLDRRLYTTAYEENQVYPIYAVNGLVTSIVFAEDEKVDVHTSGFSTAWEFAARGNHFFLKPRAKEGSTNLVVVTNKRTYHFDLRLGWNRKTATYELAFTYPKEEATKRAAASEKERVEARLKTSTTKPMTGASPIFVLVKAAISPRSIALWMRRKRCSTRM